MNITTFVSLKDNNDPHTEITFQNVQYRELIELIKYQREKLNLQQTDLTKVLMSLPQPDVCKVIGTQSQVNLALFC